MNVLITGATGLIGRALVSHLTHGGHTVSALVRPRDWSPETGFIAEDRLEGFDAVVHLAGENIASSRWSEQKKASILKSRVDGTRLLVETLTHLKRPPKVLVSASAIGIYGNRGDEALTEDSSSGDGFLPEVCRAWEAEADAASTAGIRVVRLRIGVVLSADGGILTQMLGPFRMGVGGILGNGRQFMSWISLEDLCRTIAHVMQTESLQGPVNAVSPHAVQNRDFTAVLAGAVGRPALLPIPRFGVRLFLGQLAEELVLASTRVVPEKLLASNFRFDDADLAVAISKNVPGVSRLRLSQWIARPVEEVFPFFTDASNLEFLTPRWLKFEILTPGVEIRRGALIDYRLRIHGFPIQWQSEIVEWDPPNRFIDVQRRGPYGLWTHEHRFEPHEDGSLVYDDVRYSVPGGAMVRKLLVDRDLERVFTYRKEQLARHFA